MLDKFLATFCTIASSFFFPQSSSPEWPPVTSVPVQLALLIPSCTGVPGETVTLAEI